ncbi:MAG: bifunctional phosphoglucose/phosphomannose isomerase [Patescibacteria group bacterium]
MTDNFYNNFIAELKSWSQQLKWQPDIELPTLAENLPIVVAGMGGSGLPGRILKTYSQKQIINHHNYGLPQNITKATLVAISYSGNTTETIDALKTALKANWPVVVITGGGQLKQLAIDYNLPLIEIPPIVSQPRLALPIVTKILAHILLETNIIQEIEKTANQLAFDSLTSIAQAMAQNTQNNWPVILTTAEYATLAYIWKISINENAKRPALISIIPEMNHNEIEGLLNNKQEISLIALTASQKNNHPNQKRLNLTLEIAKDLNQVTFVYDLLNEQINNFWNGTLLGNLYSLELAKINGTDPLTVPVIEKFKQKLSSTDDFTKKI